MKSTKTGLIIAAAFIGPGTVTTASLAGAQLGYGLLWALLFSVFATYTLQEMASRLGLVTRQGLSENMLSLSANPLNKGLLIGLIVAAIGIGNAAYEGGNITGAALGLSAISSIAQPWWVLLLGLTALALIWSNRYVLIENALVSLVVLMSIVFVVVALIAGVNGRLFINGLAGEGLFSNVTLLLAIIGTTIVPYNLFLHANLSVKQGTDFARSDNIPLALSSHRNQLICSIGLGGLVTLAIMSCAANAFFIAQTQLNPNNIAQQLAPLLGDYANVFFALGLFAAGLTSAITAPMATAFALCGLFKLSTQVHLLPFKVISTVIIVIGMAIALSGIKPFSIIVIAQAANAMLLPITAVVLLVLVNQTRIMGQYTNTLLNNICGGIIVLIVLGLGGIKLFNIF